MNDTRLLMVFVKNPVKGKVKTRLAKSLGEEQTLEIYKKLIGHTRRVIEALACKKVIYYSDHVDQYDDWHPGIYSKELQNGNDLGAKMANAFRKGLKSHNKVIIIGSDCPGISRKIIGDGFKMLEDKEVVIGPAEDGGYYLLGMNKYHPFLFEDLKWGTSSVFSDTLGKIKSHRLDHGLLPELVDIDEKKDLKLSGWKAGQKIATT